jgi:prepilin-type N-terminal cleavage/methylation domain-containing protein
MSRNHFLNLRRTSAGFTLMELLVSMTLMGLVALAMLFGFRIGTSAWAKGASGLDRARGTQATFDVLSRQIGSMKAYYSMQKLKEAPVELLLFQGTSAGVRFVSTFSFQSRSSGGLWLVEYFATRSKESEPMRLMLNETPLPTDEALTDALFNDIDLGEDNQPVVHFPEFQLRPDSISLVEEADDVLFKYIWPPEQAQARVRAPGTRERLPQGVEIQLRWNEPGLLSAREFVVVVPVHAGATQ